MKDVTENQSVRVGDGIIERKIQYDSKVVEHACQVLKADSEVMVLFHEITNSFAIEANGSVMTIPQGSYTIAYYWLNRPYNVYMWKDQNGNDIGSYFNIVRNTTFQHNSITFEDLIVDLLIFPDGETAVLDLDELPEQLSGFEEGHVDRSLQELIQSLDTLLPALREEINNEYQHKKLLRWLDR